MFINEIASRLFPFKDLTPQEMRNRYMYLGPEKWRECIDRAHAVYGKEVYEKGLHGGHKEPGYLADMMRVFEYINENITKEPSTELFLQIHSLACAHFETLGPEAGVCKGDLVGVFRTEAAAAKLWPDYTILKETEKEMNEFNKLIGNALPTVFVYRKVAIKLEGLDEGLVAFLRQNFAIQHGHAIYDRICFNKLTAHQQEQLNPLLKPIHWVLGHAACSSRMEMFIRFMRVLKIYKESMLESHSYEAKLEAIARFYQRVGWLHLVADGSGRTNLALLNMMLVQNGFHPVVMDDPCISDIVGFDEWFKELKIGLLNWQKLAIKQAAIKAALHQQYIAGEEITPDTLTYEPCHAQC